MYGPLWTIAVEFKFYLMFPLLVQVYGKRSFFWFGLTLLFVVFRWLIVSAYSTPGERFYFTFLGRFDQILIGVLVALLLARLPTAKAYVSIAEIAIGMTALTLFFGYSSENLTPKALTIWCAFGPTIEALGWAFVLIGTVTCPLRMPRIEAFFGALGKLSYSEYVLHIIVLQATSHSFGGYRPMLGAPLPDAVLNCFLFVIPGVLALSFLAYTFIEKPFLSLKVNYMR